MSSVIRRNLPSINLHTRMDVVWEGPYRIQDALASETCWNEHQLLVTECELKPEFTSDSKTKTAVYSSEVTTRNFTGSILLLLLVS